MKKTLKLIICLITLISIHTTVSAETTTNTFSRITSDEIEEQMTFVVNEISMEIEENTVSFSFQDYLTKNTFKTLNSKETISNKELLEEVIPEVTRSRTIIKDEIERIKKEEQEKLEREKRKEEERKRLARYQETMNINLTSSNAFDVFKSTLLAQLGKPYVYGGNGPSSFDCSGLSSYVYRKIGVNLPRVASDQQRTGVSVNRTMEDLRYGDLVFFKDPNATGASHVGIYVGNGQMIHAPRTGDVVKYTNIFTGYYKNRFFSAKRFVDFEALSNPTPVEEKVNETTETENKEE